MFLLQDSVYALMLQEKNIYQVNANFSKFSSNGMTLLFIKFLINAVLKVSMNKKHHFLFLDP